MEQKTPLYDWHVRHGGKMVEFGGWMLPVQYTSIMEEHRAVRSQAGLFDASHMGEVMIEGPGALAFLNALCTNDFTSMAAGKCRYSPMCNERGGTLDDLLVYKLGEERYMAVVNASNTARDFAHMQSNATQDVTLRNAGADIALLALQGPAYRDVLAGLNIEGALPTGFYTFKEQVRINGVDCLISRTGYTGEPGVEIYCPAASAEALADALLAAGGAHGLLPCGLGARDTLRFECAMPLYGHELSEEITPLEANLGAFVKPDKPFIGRDVLLGPAARKRIGLEMVERGIARQGCAVTEGGKAVGFVTSGMPAPTLGKNLAMAIVNVETGGEELFVDLRGKAVRAKVVPLPFYQSSNK